jgi:hypothetical protein
MRVSGNRRSAEESDVIDRRVEESGLCVMNVKVDVVQKAVNRGVGVVGRHGLLVSVSTFVE